MTDDLARLRERAPLTHCLTNTVVQNFTANVLLAAGAAPAMVPAVEEAGDFARIADALLVNVGTLTGPDAAAMRIAVAAAREAHTPWVLDPVAIGSLTLRTGLAVELLDQSPTIVRGNPSEILALAGQAGGGRGVDSTAGVDEAVDAARDLARRTGSVIAVSGVVDHVTDGRTVATVAGGDALLTKVTGAGCALGALMAAFCAVSSTPLDAAVAASQLMATAAERAAAQARGPGSFAVALLDELAAATS
jgi:hydroxyethylthiazole kinase